MGIIETMIAVAYTLGRVVSFGAVAISGGLIAVSELLQMFG